MAAYTAVWLLAAGAAFKVLQAVYNVFFHPLKDFPGPVAAKATIWWRIYIDMVKKESMVDVLTRLHKIYGQWLLTLTY